MSVCSCADVPETSTYRSAAPLCCPSRSSVRDLVYGVIEDQPNVRLRLAALAICWPGPSWTSLDRSLHTPLQGQVPGSRLASHTISALSKAQTPHASLGWPQGTLSARPSGERYGQRLSMCPANGRTGGNHASQAIPVQEFRPATFRWAGRTHSDCRTVHRHGNMYYQVEAPRRWSYVDDRPNTKSQRVTHNNPRAGHAMYS